MGHELAPMQEQARGRERVLKKAACSGRGTVETSF